MVFVTSAENDGVDVLGGAVFEGAGFTFDLLEKGLGLELLGPVEAHGTRAVAASDVLAAILPHLRCDIFGGI